MVRNRVILERRFVPKDSIIIEEGDVAYSAYLIQSGSVSVYSKSSGREIELARLGVGEICGEMALIDEQARSANVRALEDCNLIVITRTAFENKLSDSDTTVQAIVKMLIKRIKSSNVTVLDKQENTRSMVEVTEKSCENLYETLNDQQKNDFDKTVRPRLGSFINAISRFFDDD